MGLTRPSLSLSLLLLLLFFFLSFLFPRGYHVLCVVCMYLNWDPMHLFLPFFLLSYCPPLFSSTLLLFFYPFTLSLFSLLISLFRLSFHSSISSFFYHSFSHPSYHPSFFCSIFQFSIFDLNIVFFFSTSLFFQQFLRLTHQWQLIPFSSPLLSSPSPLSLSLPLPFSHPHSIFLHCGNSPEGGQYFSPLVSTFFSLHESSHCLISHHFIPFQCSSLSIFSSIPSISTSSPYLQ